MRTKQLIKLFAVVGFVAVTLGAQTQTQSQAKNLFGSVKQKLADKINTKNLVQTGEAPMKSGMIAEDDVPTVLNTLAQVEAEGIAVVDCGCDLNLKDFRGPPSP